jgi:folylpolyglutamate synthase/dihydropteroate synthase
MSPETLREISDHPHVRVARTLREALAMAAAAPPKDVVFITGSLFLVAEARELLGVYSGD